MSCIRLAVGVSVELAHRTAARHISGSVRSMIHYSRITILQSGGGQRIHCISARFSISICHTHTADENGRYLDSTEHIVVEERHAPRPATLISTKQLAEVTTSNAPAHRFSELTYS